MICVVYGWLGWRERECVCVCTDWLLGPPLAHLAVVDAVVVLRTTTFNCKIEKDNLWRLNCYCCSLRLNWPPPPPAKIPLASTTFHKCQLEQGHRGSSSNESSINAADEGIKKLSPSASASSKKRWFIPNSLQSWARFLQPQQHSWKACQNVIWWKGKKERLTQMHCAYVCAHLQRYFVADDH